jgi:hypothetical protein
MTFHVGRSIFDSFIVVFAIRGSIQSKTGCLVEALEAAAFSAK